MKELDKRQHPRKPVWLKVKFRTIQDFLTCYARNISKGGMFLQMARPMDIGTQLTLLLGLPAAQKEIQTEALVVHVVDQAKAREAGRLPGVGVRFIDPADGFRNQVEQYINDLSAAGVLDEAPPSNQVAEKPRPDIRGKTVLLVDDDAFFRESLSGELAARETNVLLAADAFEAREILERQGADIRLILLDILMPKVNGFEFMLDIEKRYPEVPVVFISVKDQPSVRKMALGMGAMEFIPKNQPMPGFVEQIIGALRRAVA